MSKNTLGELIKNAREKKGMSQRELSRQSGIDNNTIAKLEKGERKKPNIFALKRQKRRPRNVQSQRRDQMWTSPVALQFHSHP